MESEMLRWSLGAKEILFTNPFYRYFFGHCGKSIAIERGAGLYQEGMQQSIDILNKGGWVHVFPEGKVHKDGTLHKLRWGIGKLVESAHPTPYVLPFYHLGMDKVMPGNRIPRPLFKDVSILVGEPLYFEEENMVHWIIIDITNKVELEMRKLEQKLYDLQK